MPKKEYSAKEFVEVLKKKNPDMTVSKLNYLRLKNKVKFRKTGNTYLYHE